MFEATSRGLMSAFAGRGALREAPNTFLTAGRTDWCEALDEVVTEKSELDWLAGIVKCPSLPGSKPPATRVRTEGCRSLQELADFIDQHGGKHRVQAGVDAVMELSARPQRRDEDLPLAGGTASSKVRLRWLSGSPVTRKDLTRTNDRDCRGMKFGGHSGSNYHEQLGNGQQQPQAPFQMARRNSQRVAGP